MVSSILRRNVWRFSELSSTKSSSCFYSPSLHLKAFQKHSSYKTETVSEHIITLSTRPLHMVMGNDDYKSGNHAQFVIKTDWLMLQLSSMAAKLCSLRDMQGLYKFTFSFFFMYFMIHSKLYPHSKSMEDSIDHYHLLFIL